MKLKVDYFSGAGNLFTAIDNKNYGLEKADFEKFATNLVAENEIISQKTEGIIVLNTSDKVDFDVWFFNPDGTYGMMCGNGGRCAIRFAFLQQYFSDEKKELNFSMNGRLYKGIINENNITIFFDAPNQVSDMMKINLANQEIEGRYIDVGTEHFVVKIEDVAKIDIANIGKEIRFHNQFEPTGLNANFYSVLDENTLKIRTYERGVEAETAACGTGSISTALTYYKLSGKKKIKLIPKSNSILEVEILVDLNNICGITLKGSAEKIGEKMLKV